MYYLFTVLPETQLSQQRSIHNQISDGFSRGHDPIAHARRARCLKLVKLFIECVIVIVIVMITGRSAGYGIAKPTNKTTLHTASMSDPR